MLTEEQIITIKKAAIATDPGKPWGDSIAFARAIESAVRAELMRGEFICHKCGIRQDAPKRADQHKTGSTLKPDWHDRPTEPGLWLVHAKGSRTDVMACTIVTDEMMACIDEAIDADIDYCGPYALPPDTKEEK